MNSSQDNAQKLIASDYPFNAMDGKGCSGCQWKDIIVGEIQNDMFLGEVAA